MKREESLERGKSYLDEATENMTFEEFLWTFEEVWHGVGWVLNSLLDSPKLTLNLGEKGQLPKPGSLAALLKEIPKPPKSARVVQRLEAVRPTLNTLENAPKAAIERLVFEAWELHDACGLRLNLVDDRLGDKLILTDVSPGRVGSRVIERRTALKLLVVGGVLPLQACTKIERDNRSVASQPAPEAKPTTTNQAQIKAVTPIAGMQFETTDPFLFCAHHEDAYPTGDEKLGPKASLEGRHLGRDFEGKDGWNMYHGRTVPGFPRHPHRGFETVTFVRSGLLDHSDSMGAAARYGDGDVQWLTAGGGIQHAEMFPLLRSETANPLELFQIWVNLPRSNKMVPPHFTMLWNEKIPRVVETDAQGRVVEITVAAGRYKDISPPSPPPNSYASQAQSDLAIWNLKLEPGAIFDLPAVKTGTHRSLYIHRGGGLRIAERNVPNKNRVQVDDEGVLRLINGSEETEILLLQARPIDEPVAKRGPFVMNTQDEIRQAYADYQRTQFGGWPWQADDPVHVRTKGRFAKHIDGTFEEPT
jgi:redox-sensitive bicupin YhaK (pirin superfamily)